MFRHNKPLFRARSKGLGRLAHSVYVAMDLRFLSPVSPALARYIRSQFSAL